MAAHQAPSHWDSPGKNTGVGCHFLLQCMKVKNENEVAHGIRPSATPWTAAFQAPPFMGFSRQEYWSGVPLLSPPFCPGGGNNFPLLLGSACLLGHVFLHWPTPPSVSLQISLFIQTTWRDFVSCWDPDLLLIQCLCVNVCVCVCVYCTTL